MVRQVHLSVDNLIQPIFVTHGSEVRAEITSMPGVCQHSVDQLEAECNEIARHRIPAVILFGIPAVKDEIGSDGSDANGIVQRAIREVKKTHPDLIVIADACLCEYTSHGHCGIVNDGTHANLPDDYILNDETLSHLCEVAVSQAEAGAGHNCPKWHDG